MSSAFVLAALLLAAPGPFEGRRIALVAGVDQFDDAAWPALKYPKKDAADIRAALTDFDEIIDVGDGPVTRAAFRRAFDRLVDLNTSDLDTVVVYISTHGTLARNQSGELERVLVFTDTLERTATETGLRYDELVQGISRLRSRRKVAIVAACHSGGGKSRLTAQVEKELKQLKGPFFPEPAPDLSEGQLILSASAWGEPAREDDALGNDVYTHFLVQALAGFDRNGDGATTAVEAHDYARARTLEFTRGRQHPTLVAELVGDAPIVLRGEVKRTGDPVVAAYGARFEGATISIDGAHKGTLPGGVSVKPGRRRVRVAHGDGAALLEREVLVEPGAVVILDRLNDAARPAVWQVAGGAGAQFVRGVDTRRRILGSYYLVSARFERLFIDGRLAVGVEVAGTTIDQSVRAPEATTQDLWLAKPAVRAAYVVSRTAWFDVTPHVHAGWAVGRRRVDAALARPSQFMSFAFAGAGLSVSHWLNDDIAVGVRADADTFLLRIDDDTRIVFADGYALELGGRF